MAIENQTLIWSLVRIIKKEKKHNGRNTNG